MMFLIHGNRLGDQPVGIAGRPPSDATPEMLDTFLERLIAQLAVYLGADDGSWDWYAWEWTTEWREYGP